MKKCVYITTFLLTVLYISNKLIIQAFAKKQSKGNLIEIKPYANLEMTKCYLDKRIKEMISQVSVPEMVDY